MTASSQRQDYFCPLQGVGAGIGSRPQPGTPATSSTSPSPSEATSLRSCTTFGTHKGIPVCGLPVPLLCGRRWVVIHGRYAWHRPACKRIRWEYANSVNDEGQSMFLGTNSDATACSSLGACMRSDSPTYSMTQHSPASRPLARQHWQPPHLTSAC